MEDVFIFTSVHFKIWTSLVKGLNQYFNPQSIFNTSAYKYYVYTTSFRWAWHLKILLHWPECKPLTVRVTAIANANGWLHSLLGMKNIIISHHFSGTQTEVDFCVHTKNIGTSGPSKALFGKSKYTFVCISQWWWSNHSGHTKINDVCKTKSGQQLVVSRASK